MSVEQDPSDQPGERPVSDRPGTERAKARRERAQARARVDILEAALRAFAASGYRATKMADIAAEAGYTAASLYTYFASKHEITTALAGMLVDEIVNAWGPVPALGPDPVDFQTFAARLRERARGVLAHIERRGEGLLFFLKLRWSGEIEGADFETGQRKEQRIRERLKAVLEGIGIRHVSGIDPETVSSAFGGLIESMLMRAVLTGELPRLVDEAERFTAFLLYGIRGER